MGVAEDDDDFRLTDGWPQWRGPKRDGHGVGLPKRWSPPERLWRFELSSQGVGGIAANPEMVVVSSRDRRDANDLFYVLDAESGLLITQLEYAAPGHLDYGNSPRATPILTKNFLFLQGAMGHVHCIDSITGEVRWKRHLIEDMGGWLPTWGFSSSPVLVEGKLIVQPGSPGNSIAALDAKSGDIVWSTPGKKAAYASPVNMVHLGLQQIVGLDQNSIGGWSLLDGKRLWELVPPIKGDFNVPTPVLFGDRFALVSENNATRLYQLDASGAALPQPIAQSEKLAGDSHSPIAIGNRLIGVDGELVVLDAQDQFRLQCSFSDNALSNYCSLIAEEDRVLVTCENGTILLLQVSADRVDELGRFSVLEDGGELLSHPALVNGTLYVRGTTWIDAYRWKMP